MTDQPEEIVMFIHDPRIPAEIYEHAMQFRQAVVEVIQDGHEFYLFDADGELVDMCWLK